MSFYKNHLFICTHQKEAGKLCCGNHNAVSMVAYAKQKAAALGLTKEQGFRISGASCMGRCADGPVLVVYPQGTWYTYTNEDDIDRILAGIVNSRTCNEQLI